jgi:hypothetical protein
VRVRYVEGLAIHSGPESCAVIREGFGEALTGVRAGQPLSRERLYLGCQHGLKRGRQHGGVHYCEHPDGPTWS